MAISEKAHKVYEQVQKIKNAEEEIERLLGSGPKRGRPPKEEKHETNVEAET